MRHSFFPQHFADALDVQAVQCIAYALAQRDVVRRQRRQVDVVGEVVAREAVRLEEVQAAVAVEEQGSIRLLHQQQRVQRAREQGTKYRPATEAVI